MNLRTIFSKILAPLKGAADIDLSVPSIKSAYEVGLSNQDGMLANPYTKGTRQYQAWERGSEERVRKDMTIW
jgi:hypothetical protein